MRPSDSGSSEAIEAAVLDSVASLVRELGSEQTARRVTLRSSLDTDLGLGSLERVELLVRIESALGLRLPETKVQTVETPEDWVRVVRESGPSGRAAQRWPIVQPTREAYPPPADARTFSQVLRKQAERDPARVHIHLLDRDSGRDISHGQLFERASRVAAGLVSSGLKHGQTVAIMLPTCEDFFSSFLGVMLAGGVAVPVYPPARANQLEQYIRRQTLILRSADVRFLISFDRVQAVAKVLASDLPALREFVSVPELEERGRYGPPPEVEPAEIFFIQYTSGSTGNPKGVALTHSNVLANIKGIGSAVRVNPSDVVVSWLPLYHDMGLIGSWLFSLYHGLPITVMSPLDFLVRPARWLWALSDSGGTLCPAPNFAFELCVRKITDEAMAGVSLSKWRVAINAGEPVLPATLQKFTERFQAWGFDPRSFMPFYGLAESSVALTNPPYWRGPLVDSVDRAVFECEGRAVPSRAEESREVLEFVGNGKALPDHELRVVDNGGRDLPDRRRGRIVFRGPSRTPGYFRNPQATSEVLDGEGWLDSGDLGYIAEGELYVTGRLKDCIIKGGRNIIPQDVEMAAWEVDGVRKGCVAAFGSLDRESGTERLVVVAETRVTDASALARIQRHVTESVAANVGIPPDDVALVRPGTVPKTSSGKLQRLATRRLYDEGDLLNRPPAAAWAQMARLWLRGAASSRLRQARRLGCVLRIGAKNALGGLLAMVFGLAARVVPTPRVARHMVGIGARGVAALGGLRAAGSLGNAGGGVMLVNRSHRMDPLLVAAAFRSAFVFADRTGFGELGPAEAFLLDPLVAPLDGAGRVPAAGALLHAMEAALGAGCAVVSFADNPVGEPPERTRFRAEGFAAAARSGAPAVPVLLRRQAAGRVAAVQGDPLDGNATNGDRAASREAVRAFLTKALGPDSAL